MINVKHDTRDRFEKSRQISLRSCSYASESNVRAHFHTAPIVAEDVGGRFRQGRDKAIRKCRSRHLITAHWNGRFDRLFADSRYRVCRTFARRSPQVEIVCVASELTGTGNPAGRSVDQLTNPPVKPVGHRSQYLRDWPIREDFTSELNYLCGELL